MQFDFIAIDFETANADYSSACSLGLVAVKDLKIAEENYFLIQPPGNKFNQINVNIHGISSDAVKDAPFFPEIWYQIKNYFDDNIIIAHNASFDMAVLKKCMFVYNIPYPDFKYLCSIPISSCACRGEGVGQSLEKRAQYFNIDMGQHHNALSDATTCALIVLETIKACNRKSFENFYRTYSSIEYRYFSDVQVKNEFRKDSTKFQKIVISELAPTKEIINKNHVFYGKNIVFTGELKTLGRKEAMQKVIDMGGIVKGGVTKQTDFIVVGVQDCDLVGADGMSCKEEKAYALIKSGYDIKILNELEFIKFIS